MSDIILKVKNLKTYFDIVDKSSMFIRKKNTLKAVDGVTFDIKRGETLCVVGESGCGKSTLARTIAGLVPSRGGSIEFQGRDITNMLGHKAIENRKHIQLIFQDPLASLDPRMTIGSIIEEPLINIMKHMNKKERKARVRDIMDKVGLLPNLINRYPHEFSGGQCQRISIARTLVVEPELLICDEPVSALDVSIQAQVTNLLKDLQKEFNMTLLFITHDLSIVKHISDRVLVMYLGNVVEFGDNETIYRDIKHPYTKALMDAIPIADPRLDQKNHEPLEGELPSPINPPSGCVFRTRCPKVMDRCSVSKPELKKLDNGTYTSCFLY